MIALRAFVPPHAGLVLARHAAHYAAAHGIDASFAAFVAQVLEDVGPARAQGRAEGWIAWVEDDRAAPSSHQDRPRTSCKAGFSPSTRRGAGRAPASDFWMRRATTAASRAAPARWCVCREHGAAGRIYARNGIRRLSVAPVHSFGRALSDEAWELPLQPG